MSETVEVTVKLPKPPTGWEWSQCLSGRCDEGHFNESRTTFWLHRVAPPERMVTVTLSEDAWRFIRASVQKAPELKAIIDKALAQDVCRARVHTEKDGEVLSCSIEPIPVPADHITDSCALPKGHEGSHNPEVKHGDN